MNAGHDNVAGFHASSSSSIHAVKDVTVAEFGSIAGIAGEVLEYPFDLAKVRLQSQVLDNAARFGGEGILNRGLYRLVPFGAMAEPAALFVAYTRLQDLIYWSISNTPSLAGAGFLISFLMAPIELVKCKMQPVGHVSTMIRKTGRTAWFTSKEHFASLLLAKRTQYQPSLFGSSAPQHQSTELLPWESALSGALAGELRPPDKYTHPAHLTSKVGGFWQTARATYKV
ncbi:hypothetical protein V8E55_006957 [Tylopilus felleus]